VEVVVACVLMAVLFYGGHAGLGTFARRVGRGDLSADQLQQLTKGSETIAREIREARQIIFPVPGSSSTNRILFFRNFEGEIVAYYYRPDKRELRKAVLVLDQIEPVVDIVVKNLDGAYFSVSALDLVSWGLFVADAGILGSSGRKNQ